MEALKMSDQVNILEHASYFMYTHFRGKLKRGKEEEGSTNYNF